MIQALLKQSVVYGLSTVFARGAQVVTLLVLPLILSPIDYGAFQILITIGILISFVVPLEISQALARFLPGANGGDSKLFSSAAWWFTAGSFAVFMFLGLIFSKPLCNWVLHDLSYLVAFRLGVVFIALTGVFFFLQNQCRWQFDFWGYALLSVTYAASTMAGAITLGLVAEPRIEAVLVGQVAGALVAVLLGLFRLRRYFVLLIDSAKLKTMLRFSLPLVPANVAVFASVYGSRLILNSEASLRDVGIFTYGNQIGSIAVLSILGLHAALTPMIMTHHNDPHTPPTIARLFEGFTAFALLLCLSLGLFAREFIDFFGNPDYADSSPLVILLAPAMLLSQMYIFSPGFAIAKKTIWQLWVSLFAAAVGIAANLVFIDFWGVQGAAWATLLAALTFFGCWFALGQRLYPIPVRWRRVSLAAVAAILCAGAGLFAGPEELSIRLPYKAALIAAAALAFLALGLIPRAFLLRIAPSLGPRSPQKSLSSGAEGASIAPPTE